MSEALPIKPVTHPVDAIINLPGSKSITNRALLMAALANGLSHLQGALFSDDTRYMAAALQRLGITVCGNEREQFYEVEGTGGVIPASRGDLFIGNAGTAARFLTAYLALGHGTYRLDGVPRMRQRPIGDLLAALQSLGVDAIAEHDDGCPPLVIHANGFKGGKVSVRSDVSSQYLSALLLVSPYSKEGVTIDVTGNLSSEPYIGITVEMMKRWGVTLTHENLRHFEIPSGQCYTPLHYPIEADATGASYFFAGAAVTGSRVRVNGLGTHSLQGDVAFVDILREMGCEVIQEENYIEVCGGEELRGVDANMNAISDTVMTLAAIAPFCTGPTRIHDIAHIRQKETDRIRALATELKRIGVAVEETEDSLTIHPAKQLIPAEIETYDDHRMAMSFAITGLRSPGIAIKDPSCVAKTFPDFFKRLRETFHPETVQN